MFALICVEEPRLPYYLNCFHTGFMAKYSTPTPITLKIVPPTPKTPNNIPLSDAIKIAFTTKMVNPIFFHVHSIHTATKFRILNSAYTLSAHEGILGIAFIIVADPSVYEYTVDIAPKVIRVNQTVRNVGLFI